MNKITLHQKIHTGFILTMTVWIAVGITLAATGWVFSTSWQLLGGGLIVLVFMVFYATEGKWRIIPAAIITAVILFTMYIIGRERISRYISGYIDWLFRGGEMEIAFAAISVAFIGILSLLLFWLLVRFFMLRLITAVALFVFLIVAMIIGFRQQETTVCFIILFILFTLTEYLQKAEIRSRIVVYLLPFLLLYGVLLLFLPLQAEPYNWQFARSVYSSVRGNVLSITQRFSSGRGNSSFGLGVGDLAGSSTTSRETSGGGFSERPTIRGRTRPRDREMIEVELTSGRMMSVYLTGNVFANFDGMTWSHPETEDDSIHAEQESFFDAMETVYAVYRHEPERPAAYFHRGEMRVAYTHLRSGFLLAPAKTVAINPLEPWQEELLVIDSGWVFADRVGIGTEYEVVFIQMNLGHDMFRQMIIAESGYQYQEEIWDSFLNMFGRHHFLRGVDATDLNTRNLRERSEWIKATYSERYPVSEEVRALVLEVTREAASDYEKCLALEHMLSGQGEHEFTYILSPPSIPSGRDFLDYFLLESKTGYCTYYATAFVLLARELGLPARYVQGCLVNDDNLGVEIISVRESMAHAWAEVYFQGVGWIPFEATPGFATGRYRYWHPPAVMGEATPTIDRSEEMDRQAADNLIIDREVVSADTATSVQARQIAEQALLLSLVVLTVLLVAITLLLVIDHLIRSRRYQRMDNEERLHEHVRINMRILSMIGYSMGVGETWYEFAERIRIDKEKNDATRQSRIEFAERIRHSISVNFIDIWERTVYRGDTVTEAMITAARDDRDELYRIIKAKSRWLYCWVRWR
ncbi:MAG: transglutaminase-like domain-containing protein [Lachnospiraceae bacterium]|nr:transglutaminase-like domain-containing protein [Lachnospiraceae bacterium]